MGPGNEHDRRRLEEALGGLRVKKSGRGRARTRPKGVYADAADDAKAIREGLRRRGIRAGIPKNPRRGKGTRGESGRSGVGGLIGRLEAAWSGSSDGGKGVPKVDRSARGAACHLPGLRPPRRLPLRLENFEMSSRPLRIPFHLAFGKSVEAAGSPRSVPRPGG